MHSVKKTLEENGENVKKKIEFIDGLPSLIPRRPKAEPPVEEGEDNASDIENIERPSKREGVEQPEDVQRPPKKRKVEKVPSPDLVVVD